jgi:mannose-6-phosphate isomerase-like protein (cupin superfamily)
MSPENATGTRTGWPIWRLIPKARSPFKTVKDFPAFMKSDKNDIDPGMQSDGIDGWIYDGADGKQMAYWLCRTSGVSKEHVHVFDEYFTVVQGTYTLIINGQHIKMCRGDEYYIPRNVPHAGEFCAGTRTIHCFGGRRAKHAR